MTLKCWSLTRPATDSAMVVICYTQNGHPYVFLIISDTQNSILSQIQKLLGTAYNALRRVYKSNTTKNLLLVLITKNIYIKMATAHSLILTISSLQKSEKSDHPA